MNAMQARRHPLIVKRSPMNIVGHINSFGGNVDQRERGASDTMTTKHCLGFKVAVLVFAEIKVREWYPRCEKGLNDGLKSNPSTVYLDR